MSTLTADQIRDLLARLLGDIAPEVDLADATADGDLQEELGLDSMDFLNLMVAIHEETGVDIPERDYPELASVDGVVDYLTRRLTS